MGASLSLHSAQYEVARHRARFKVIVAGRRFGKSHLCKVQIIAKAGKINNGRIWYIAPSFRMAKQIMWRELMNAVPRSWLAKKPNETELTMYLKNGTEISCKGADSPDSLRGVGLDYVVLDEYQDMRREVWEECIRPTLASTGGEAMFIGCVRGDTYVLSETDGFQPIEHYNQEEIAKSLTPINHAFYGSYRRHHTADGFWNNGVVPTIKIRTKMGFELESSEPHPILVMGADGIPVWKRARDLCIGDRTAQSVGMDVWAEKDPLSGLQEHMAAFRARYRSMARIECESMSDDLAYFLGLWLAEGSVEQNIGRVTLTCGDKEALEWLVERGLCGFKFHWRREDQIALNSYEFVEMMRFVGMPLVKATEKTLPAWVLNGRESWARHFVAGMWDGDGHINSKGAQVAGYTSGSHKMIQQLQLLLQNMGIVARVTYDHITPPTERVAVSSTSHRLKLTGLALEAFSERISLRIKRKADALRCYDFKRRNSHAKVGNIPNQYPLVKTVWQSRTKNRIRDGHQYDYNLYSLIEQFRSAKHGVNYETLKEFLVRIADHVDDTNEAAVCAFEELSKNAFDSYFWDEIVSLTPGEAQTYDFTIPETHSFWSNGFISHNTPKSFNLLYDAYVLGQDKTKKQWMSWNFPTIASPFIPKHEIEQARQDMDPRTFRQEFEASFESVSGRVYYPFDRRLHVNDGVKFNPHLPIWVGMDFNIDPMSIAVIQEQEDGSLWIVDEIVQFNSNVDEAAAELARRYWRYMKQITIYPDPAAKSRQHARGETSLDILREHGFNYIKYRRKHPAIDDRINCVNRQLLTASGKVGVYVSPHCKHVIRSFEQTMYKEGSRDINKLMSVEHITDAIGYCFEYERPMRKVKIQGISL